MTYLAMRNKFPPKAAATFGGITDMEMFIQDFPDAENLFHQIYPDYKTNRDQIFL